MNERSITGSRRHRAAKQITGTGLVVLVAVASLLVPQIAANAAPVADTINGITYTADDANAVAGATVTAYTPGSLNVTIPNTVTLSGTTYNVTHISSNAFNGKGLTDITLPDTLLTIGDSAFFGNDLASVVIPASVTDIHDGAFYDNPQLVEFYFNPMTAPTLHNPSGRCLFGALKTPPQLLHYPFGATGYDATWNTCGYAMVQDGKVGSYTVTFDSDGGSAVANQQVNGGALATKPTDPSKAGYSFAGWQITGSAGGYVSYDFAWPVTENITLVALWNQTHTQPAQQTTPKPRATAKVQALANTGAAETSPLLAVIFGLLAAGAVILAVQRRTRIN